jgi:hypothetical protein
MNTQAPVEDIHAIVGRFQAWAGTQTAPSHRDEVRELTYEEAIKASRHRSSSSRAATVSPLSAVKAAPLPEHKEPAKPKKRKTQQQKQRTKTKRVSHREVNLVAPPEGKPAFRQVLSESIAALPVVVPQSAAIAQRAASLSIRVSAKEQALIKARAAEAGLTVSAYLRQCALEVELLRAQLQQALAARPQHFMPTQLPSVAAPGLFARLGRWFFGRRTPALAVRA